MHTTTRTRVVRTLLLTAAASTLISGTAAASTATAAPSDGALSAASTAAAAKRAHCERGEFCTWQRAFYRGTIHRVDLRSANPGECIPLTPATDGRSFANRTSRDITVYQGRDCSTEGDFTTYPGGGTFVPDAPFVVRALQIWE
ncbi:MAG: peptidase inhibitor family I36 protein [Thermocrispum sp.]